MEKLLKEWRQDAMHKHQYETAIYIGDKLLALTGMPIFTSLKDYEVIVF